MVKSRRGGVLAIVRIKDSILKGTIYMNSHYGKTLCVGDRKLANLITNTAYDINSKQPEFKFSAVNIVEPQHRSTKFMKGKTIKKSLVPKIQTVKFIENLFSASVDGIVVTDANQKIIMVNNSFCSFFGLSSNDMIETSILEWFQQYNDSMVRNWCELEKNIYINNSCRDVEFKKVLPDRTVYFMVNASLLYQTESENAVIISIWRDITKLKQIQNELIRKEKFAVIGRISGSIAHDIRHPLATIKSSAYYLNTTLNELDEKTRKHLRLIDSEINHANEIITSFVRLSESRVPDKGRININEYIKDFFAESPLLKQQKLVKQFDNESPHIMVDCIQLKQVFINITSNAVHNMSDGGVLTVKTEVVRAAGLEHKVKSAKSGVKRAEGKESDILTQNFECGGDFVKISFVDTGSGIRKEILDKIFDPFFTTQGKGMGLGLGLSIVKEIIVSNGGYITVESEEGEGCTFIIKFPIINDL